MSYSAASYIVHKVWSFSSCLVVIRIIKKTKVRPHAVHLEKLKIGPMLYT